MIKNNPYIDEIVSIFDELDKIYTMNPLFGVEHKIKTDSLIRWYRRHNAPDEFKSNSIDNIYGLLEYLSNRYGAGIKFHCVENNPEGKSFGPPVNVNEDRCWIDGVEIVSLSDWLDDAKQKRIALKRII